jgi:dienelactone hydrolase
MPADLTVKTEVTDDALAAVHFLQSHPRVNATRVFVAGHSLGGMMAPDIAARDSSVAGIIIMAAPARPLQSVVRDQVEYIASLSETDDRTRATLNAVLDSLDMLAQKSLPPATPVMGAPASYYYDLDAYQPARIARTLDLPIFVLHALRDYQVTEDDLNEWISALRGRSRATVNEYPALNHVFMEGRGRATPAEYAKPGHVAETVIRDIANWILLRSTT